MGITYINITELNKLLRSTIKTRVLANSSWVWLTDRRPFDILPYAVALTLIIEFIFIWRLNRVNRPLKTFAIICVANIVSFLLPYIELLIPSNVGYRVEMILNHTPTYIVRLGYLLLTLISEVPIVYLCLKNNTDNKKKLLNSIIIVNIVTTIIIAGFERIFIRGSW